MNDENAELRSRELQSVSAGATHGTALPSLCRTTALRRPALVPPLKKLIIAAPVLIDHVDLAARRHDRSNGAITQAHDARDHRALYRFEDTGGFGFRHQASDPLHGDPVLGLSPVSEGS
jgi:hypothetical protein